MKISASQLRAFLLDSGKIGEDKIKEAEKKAKKEKKTLDRVLVEAGLLDQEEIAKLEAYVLGIPFINLEDYTVPKEVLQIIPEPIARKHNIVAFKRQGKELEVAMLDPKDLQTIEFIKKKAGLKILPRLTNKEGIRSVLTQYQKSLEAEFGDIIRKDAGIIKVDEDKSDEEKSSEDLKKAAGEMPIIKIVDTLLKHAILQRASDIHIEPSEKEIVVRYRIDGILHDTMTLPRRILSGVVARIKVLADLKLDEHRLPQDGRFKIETEDNKVSFRVSILPVYSGEKIVMRLLPDRSKGFTLETLGFFGSALEVVHQNIKKPNGMILVTGPTGSGKTTTLYTVLDILNTSEVNISTVEDPIEYQMERINQTQVKPKIGLSFSNGLRALLRQDPDVIMVGEIRDNETASLAINAALTGHLVLSTLHTNSASGVFPRLIDMEVEPFLISSTINVIISQRLVRRLKSDAQEKHNLTEKEVESLGKQVDLEKVLNTLIEEKVIKKGTSWTEIDFYRPQEKEDTASCYEGRIGIHEVLEMSESVKEMVTEEKTSDEIQKQACREGMLTMLEDGFIKAAQGITSIEEVLRVTKD